MKKLVFPLVVGLCIILGCEKDDLESANAINEQWQNSAKTIDEAELLIQQIMNKYNAVAITDNKSDDFNGEYVLLDKNKKFIQLSMDDQKLVKQAKMIIKEKQIEMQHTSDIDEVFTVVEKVPSPKNGMESFYRYVQENLKYPEEARANGVEGKVYVQFVVNEFGEITKVETVKGIGSGCDEAAANLIQNAEAWNPGEQKGQFVKVRMVLPITFKL